MATVPGKTKQPMSALACFQHQHRNTQTTLRHCGQASTHDVARLHSEQQQHVHQLCGDANTNQDHCPTYGCWSRIHPPCERGLHAPTNMNRATQRRPAPHHVVLDRVPHRRHTAVAHQNGQTQFRLTESSSGCPNEQSWGRQHLHSIDTTLPPCK